MSIGPLVRRLFGPYEREVAECYRRLFVDLDDLAGLISSWIPKAQRILEVGCGEGAMTERIVKAYPAAKVTAIDISPKVGRLFRGPAFNVNFSQETVENVARHESASFDLVVLADVIHHVPLNARASLMSSIDRAMSPNGCLICKDWIVSRSPIHWLCYMSDRYLTGDKIAYYTTKGICNLLTETFGAGAIRRVGTVGPWHNNVVALVKR